MIPPTTRSYISQTFSTTTSYIKSGLGLGGKALFVLSTSALLLGVPWALAFAEEQQMVEMEKEMRMREMGGEVGFELCTLGWKKGLLIHAADFDTGCDDSWGIERTTRSAAG